MDTGSPVSSHPLDAPPPRQPSPLDMVRPRPQSFANPSWTTTLIFCCLIIGILAAWVRFELGMVKTEENRSHNFANAATLAEGRSEDLGTLLADPKTQLIELIGPPTSPVHYASLAWNDGKLRGVLFSDNLPPVASGGHYLLYGISGENDQHLLAKLDPMPGVSVYPFRATDRFAALSRFDLRDSATNAGALILSGKAP